MVLFGTGKGGTGRRGKTVRCPDQRLLSVLCSTDLHKHVLEVGEKKMPNGRSWFTDQLGNGLKPNLIGYRYGAHHLPSLSQISSCSLKYIVAKGFTWRRHNPGWNTRLGAKWRGENPEQFVRELVRGWFKLPSNTEAWKTHGLTIMFATTTPHQLVLALGGPDQLGTVGAPKAAFTPRQNKLSDSCIWELQALKSDQPGGSWQSAVHRIADQIPASSLSHWCTWP